MELNIWCQRSDINRPTRNHVTLQSSRQQFQREKKKRGRKSTGDERKGNVFRYTSREELSYPKIREGCRRGILDYRRRGSSTPFDLLLVTVWLDVNAYLSPYKKSTRPKYVFFFRLLTNKIYFFFKKFRLKRKIIPNLTVHFPYVESFVQNSLPKWYRKVLGILVRCLRTSIENPI